jgi:hypothetical protein
MTVVSLISYRTRVLVWVRGTATLGLPDGVKVVEEMAFTKIVGSDLAGPRVVPAQGDPLDVGELRCHVEGAPHDVVGDLDGLVPDSRSHLARQVVTVATVPSL